MLSPPSAAADLLNHGFSIIGYVQSYTAAACTDALGNAGSGGTVTMNGTTITIPCHLVVQMAANTIFWQDFVNGLATSVQTTNAAYDQATIAANAASTNPAMELRLEGNIVNGTYIAALGFASQQSVNLGNGKILSIDYTTGRLLVTSNAGVTVELEINDPLGRHGRKNSRDDRLSVDPDNPTIASHTGYPMCVPRVAPGAPGAAETDPLCPQKNRPKSTDLGGCRSFAGMGISFPTGGAGQFFNAGANGGPAPGGGVYCTQFVMKAVPGYPVDAATNYPPQSAIASATEADASQQVPFEAGDTIFWQGSLVRGSKGANGNDVFSVHTISGRLGVYTQPGTVPVYVQINTTNIAGDNAAAKNSVAGIPQEVQNRLVLEATVSDPTSIVDVYLIDQDADSGLELQRWTTPFNMTGRLASSTAQGFQGGVLGAVNYPKPAGNGFEGGITTQWDAAAVSRARIRANKAVAGILTSPTRTIRAVSRTLCSPADINPVAFNGAPITFAGIPSVTAATPTGLGWTGVNKAVPTVVTATGAVPVPGLTASGTTCVNRAIKRREHFREIVACLADHVAPHQVAFKSR